MIEGVGVSIYNRVTIGSQYDDGATDIAFDDSGLGFSLGIGINPIGFMTVIYFVVLGIWHRLHHDFKFTHL